MASVQIQGSPSGPLVHEQFMRLFLQSEREPSSPSTRYSKNHYERRGFTLFEVSISLALVAFGVVSVLMLFPSGIKAQQMSRFQLLAAARAMEMIDQFGSSSNTNLLREREGVNPWDTYGSDRSYSPDLETRIATYRFGMFPLPMDIARRLDSDGDEIQKILSQGGYLYYSQPSATTGFNPVGMKEKMPLPNESQKLLCAITGYAQQNAITVNPWKDWPYHAPYPSPPMHGIHGWAEDSIQATPNRFRENHNGWFLLWEDTVPGDNGDMGFVFRGIIKNKDVKPQDTLPLTSAWVDSLDVELAWENGKDKKSTGNKYHKCSGYFPYGDLGGWILDRQVSKDANNQPGLPGYWAQINPDGKKRLNNRPDNSMQPQHLPWRDPKRSSEPLPNPVYKTKDGLTEVKIKDLSRESALAYFGLAYWYAWRKGVSTNLLEGKPLSDDATLLQQSTLFKAGTNNNTALAINAARFLAHAAMCVTAHFKDSAEYTPSEDDSIPLPGTFQVFNPKTFSVKGPPAIPAVPVGGDFTIPVVLTKAVIHTYYDNAMKLVMRYAASHPYDFGAPRPMNRAIMMDFPLTQYDPFGGLVNADTTGYAGYNYGTIPNSALAQNTGAVPGPNQWRMISAQPLTNLGASNTYPGINLEAKRADIVSKGGNSHFTLTRPFDASDRCRQIVFFSVDWQSYEDFETAPSAPVDASRYPKTAPINKRSAVANLMDGDFGDRFTYNMRNPEKTLVFLEDTSQAPTGEEIRILGVDNMKDENNVQFPDRLTNGKDVFSGIYGADRNFNGTKSTRVPDVNNPDNRDFDNIIALFGKLDRGPVPKSVRMRAVVVSRFNYYDPRLPLVTR